MLQYSGLRETLGRQDLLSWRFHVGSSSLTFLRVWGRTDAATLSVEHQHHIDRSLGRFVARILVGSLMTVDGFLGLPEYPFLNLYDPPSAIS